MTKSFISINQDASSFKIANKLLWRNYSVQQKQLINNERLKVSHWI